MSPILLFGCAVAIAATVAQGPTLVFRTPDAAGVPARQDPQDPAKPPADRALADRGHVVLVIEGSVQALRITCAIAKKEPWAGAPKGLESEFALVASDGNGAERWRVPIDLSTFDTDPTHVGQPDRVEGCEVKSSRIGVLLNVPVLDGVARCTILRGEAVIGEASAAALTELLREVR